METKTRKNSAVARKPTSKDVARAAGVSQSTVSYVLTGKRPISEETKRRVERAIGDLGFVPNAGARALAGSKSGVIGLVLPLSRGVELGTNMKFVSSIAEAARTFDYDVLLATADEGPNGIARLWDSGLCDGVMLMDVEADDSRVAAIRDLGIPGVVIGVPDDRAGIVCVDLDFESAGFEAIQLLAGRGHRRIGVLSPGEQGHRKSMSFARRFARGCSRACPSNVELVVREVGSDSIVLETVTKELLGEPYGCTAFLINLSSAVEPEMAVLRHLGIRASNDIDIVALCLQDVAEKYIEEFDALLLQPEKVSYNATRSLFMQIDGQGSPGNGKLILIPAPLIRRNLGKEK
jgi:DNA-binding LacI/PurR family transcriptional regulator